MEFYKDCLSPLLFNLCFNTFVQHIKSEKYQQFGFSYKLLNPIHWFQFADDAAVITSQESENQHLLNRFAIWCQWSDMIIRVDKCSTFGIKKALTKSIQYLPKLIINNSLIPEIPISGTLSIVFLTRDKFGLNIIPPSVRFIQCQTVVGKVLKTSPNKAINELWKATSNSKNIQYDVYTPPSKFLWTFVPDKRINCKTN